ncbi:uncharacterized protein [Pyrus communis]|uniref:uncharacterized protein n=1 Tax=Pyrus communis TaxID=23211 RepID=UPI0035C11AA2
MSDGKSRCLINSLVNSPQGTWFLKLVDASASIKNEDLLYGYLDDVIQEIGEENVVQVIFDNASNYKNVGAKLMERKEKVWWTPCAAHCIDLMLEDIFKMTWFDDTLKRGRCISKYLYGHQWVLALMRKYTDNSEILCPVVTRFATCFLTLQSLQKQKENLVALFASQEWSESTYAKSREAKLAKHHVLYDHEFWGRVSFCIKGVIPLVCVLREVDSEERPPMAAWWERFGHKTPELRTLAVRVVSLTCNASGCERTWNTFSMIHTKRRNRLEHKMLNALVYVKYNLALQQRSKKRREKYDPIVVEEIASDDEWITEIEDPVLPEYPTWLEDELLYNVEAIRNVPPSIYEGGPYIREPRESSPPPLREPTPPPHEPTPPPREPTQPWGSITYKRKRGNEESSSRRNVEYDSEESFDELMTYPTRSSRVGNEEDDAFYLELDEEDVDE